MKSKLKEANPWKMPKQDHLLVERAEKILERMSRTYKNDVKSLMEEIIRKKEIQSNLTTPHSSTTKKISTGGVKTISEESGDA